MFTMHCNYNMQIMTMLFQLQLPYHQQKQQFVKK